jgi:3-methyladenine DNA glycosylase/8-oxoguanine DNA glycosylase
MRELVSKVGPLRLPPKGVRTTFNALAESIVYQQLNGKAAATIHARVCALFERGEVHPEGLLALGDGELRGAGLSRGKMLALRDLAQRTLAGTVPTLAQLGTMSDDAIVESLVQVRGIGRWTAEMLLIFRLGRPDVLPATDYGVRSGFMLAYGKRALPSPEELARHGEKWRPHRTAASWYLWRAADLAKAKATKRAPASAKPAKATPAKAKAAGAKATPAKAKAAEATGAKATPAKSKATKATRAKARPAKAPRRKRTK